MKKLVGLGIAALTVASGLSLTPATAEAQQFLYSVKFLCGQQTTAPGPPPIEPAVKPGNYATAVNIHNFQNREVPIRKKAVIARPQGQPRGAISGFVGDLLIPNQALEVDCSNIVALFPPDPPLPAFIKGFVEIISPVELSVVAVYTAQTCRGPVEDPCSVLGELDLEVVPQRSFSVGIPLPTGALAPR